MTPSPDLWVPLVLLGLIIIAAVLFNAAAERR